MFCFAINFVGKCSDGISWQLLLGFQLLKVIPVSIQSNKSFHEFGINLWCYDTGNIIDLHFTTAAPAPVMYCLVRVLVLKMVLRNICLDYLLLIWRPKSPMPRPSVCWFYASFSNCTKYYNMFIHSTQMLCWWWWSVLYMRPPSDNPVPRPASRLWLHLHSPGVFPSQRGPRPRIQFSGRNI